MTVFSAGMAIDNQAGETGSIGCFGRTVGGPTGPGVPVVLSCAHVLFAQLPDKQGVELYKSPSSTCCKNELIGRTLNSWAKGFRNVRTRVNNQDQSGAETDCAAGRLAPGVQFTNQVPQLGMISGTPPAGNLGVVVGPPFGTPPQAEHYVRFFSPVDNRVHYGTLLKSPAFTGTYLEGGSGAIDPLLYPFPVSDDIDRLSDALPNINQLLILPRPDPAEGYGPYRSGRRLRFGQHGDSGSVVLNSAGQAIGVVVRSGPKPQLAETAIEWQAASGLGVVSPIGKVMAQLDIEIPPSFSGAAPQLGAADPASPGLRARPEALAFERGMRRFREEMSATRHGRILLGLAARHGREIRRIMYGRRPALLAWHREQGPALYEHFVRALRDPAHEIPTVINGVPRARLLEVMDEMLMRFGGPELRRDLGRHRDLVLRHAPAIVRLHEIPELLARIRPDDDRAARTPEPAG